MLHKEYPDVYSPNILSVVFLANELNILGYHRVINIQNEELKSTLIEKLSNNFEIKGTESAFFPSKRSHFGLCLDNKWYQLIDKTPTSNVLAVNNLHQRIIEPIFNITDVKTDNRIQFESQGDILSKTEEPDRIIFTLAPISMDEIIDVADNNDVLPPKSTWFEPKLLDGFVIHRDKA